MLIITQITNIKTPIQRLLYALSLDGSDYKVVIVNKTGQDIKEKWRHFRTMLDLSEVDDIDKVSTEQKEILYIDSSVIPLEGSVKQIISDGHNVTSGVVLEANGWYMINLDYYGTNSSYNSQTLKKSAEQNCVKYFNKNKECVGKSSAQFVLQGKYENDTNYTDLFSAAIFNVDTRRTEQQNL